MSDHVDLRALATERPVHFMGVGGAGMYPLAELLLRSGGRVSGCDAKESAALRALTTRDTSAKRLRWSSPRRSPAVTLKSSRHGRPAFRC